MNRRGRRSVYLRFAAAVLLLAVFLLPIYWLFMIAFKTPEEIFSSPPAWYPATIQFDNFRVLFKDGDAKTVFNSLFIAGSSTLLAMFFGTIAAYSLARFRTGGENLAVWIISQRMIPPIAIVFPLYPYMNVRENIAFGLKARRKADGSPSFAEFDLSPLQDHPDIDLFFLEPEPEISAAQPADVDALILLTPRVGAASLTQNGRLAVVAQFGVGYDNVDLAACSAHDVAVVITPDGVRRPVAVSILTLIFALAGKLFVKDRLARRGPAGWAEKTVHNGVGLVGLTLGSVGVGNIGAEMFRPPRPLDMRFIAHDPYADPALAAELGVAMTDLDTVFRESDFVCVNCPLSDETHHLVNGVRLGLMKPTAFLINTARGPIVDQAALTEALQDGRIAGAGLDVFEQEPPDADDPLLTLDNVIVTPHARCWTDQLFAGSGAADVRAVMAVMAGRAPTGIVNRDVADRPGWQARLAGYAQRFGDG